jgi:hypothetical protein
LGGGRVGWPDAHLEARVSVGADGPPWTYKCSSGRMVKVQRRSHGLWSTVETGITNFEGKVRLAIPDVPGLYLAVAPRSQEGGDTCAFEASLTDRHRH